MLASVAEAERPRPMQMRLPWVGERYRATRVAIMGLNTRDDGLVTDEWSASRNFQQHLLSGRRRWGPSMFHFRTAWLASVLGDWSLGRSPAHRHPPDPVALAPAIDDLARFQAVMCSPGASGYRTPTRAMLDNCPEKQLRQQLEALRPRYVGVVGGPGRWWMAHLLGDLEEIEPDVLWVGQYSLRGGPLSVVALAHPSYVRGRRFPRGMERLVEYIDQDLDRS